MSWRERLRQAETRWLQRVSEHERNGLLRAVMLVATRLADGWGLGIVIPLALFVGGATRGLAAVGLGTASAVTTAIIVQSIKALVRRRRPTGIGLARPITAPDKHAFPSGHTAHAFGMVVITWWLAPWIGVIALVVALCVGASRLFFGLHYPTDVVVGAAFGVGLAWLTILVAERVGYLGWLLGLAS